MTSGQNLRANVNLWVFVLARFSSTHIRRPTLAQNSLTYSPLARFLSFSPFHSRFGSTVFRSIQARLLLRLRIDGSPCDDCRFGTENCAQMKRRRPFACAYCLRDAKAAAVRGRFASDSIRLVRLTLLAALAVAALCKWRARRFGNRMRARARSLWRRPISVFEWRRSVNMLLLLLLLLLRLLNVRRRRRLLLAVLLARAGGRGGGGECWNCKRAVALMRYEIRREVAHFGRDAFALRNAGAVECR